MIYDPKSKVTKKKKTNLAENARKIIQKVKTVKIS